MTNEDAILDVLVPCNSEGEQLAYPMNRIEYHRPLLRQFELLPFASFVCCGPKNYLIYLLIFFILSFFIIFLFVNYYLLGKFKVGGLGTVCLGQIGNIIKLLFCYYLGPFSSVGAELDLISKKNSVSIVSLQDSRAPAFARCKIFLR